jgi:ribosomal protein L37E
MKTLQQITRCKRCGDLLSVEEKSHTDNEGLCAFCDHMHSEALEIYQEIHAKNRVEKIRFRLV